MLFLLNQLIAKSIRLLTPWTGVWLADVEVELGDLDTVPSGRCILTVGDSIFTGTIDDKASGKFGPTAKVRVLGGGGGWSKPVRPQHYHNDVGVLSTVVLTATAAEVGEIVTQVVPSRLGVDYVRTAGPASRVLDGLDWYVDPKTGITIVGPRVPLPVLPTEVEVLSWDAEARRAEIATDTVLTPGSILVDIRFGTAIVRDVEQTFGNGQARATAWCGSQTSSRLATAIAKIVEERAGIAYLRSYRYRVVAQNPADGRLTLQAIDRGAGAPDLIPVGALYGVPGASAKILPGAQVVVKFIDGDPTKPYVTDFDDAVPIEATFDAATFVNLGKGATDFVALASLVLAQLSAIRTLYNTHTHGGVQTGTGASGPPAVPMPAPGSVAATKARAL